jgi:hypothetical protein
MFHGFPAGPCVVASSFLPHVHTLAALEGLELVPADNETGFNCVSQIESKYKAEVKVLRILVYLGIFTTAEEVLRKRPCLSRGTRRRKRPRVRWARHSQRIAGTINSVGDHAQAAEIGEVIDTAMGAARSGQFADWARVLKLAAAKAGLDTRIWCTTLLVLAWAAAAAKEARGSALCGAFSRAPAAIGRAVRAHG